MLVSPVVESCPSDNKEKAMSMLHSFYYWGHVGVVLLSTLFFQAAGIENWKLLAAVWAVVPLVNAFAFTKVPMASLMEEGETGIGIKKLFRNENILGPFDYDGMRRGKRAGCQPVGIDICGKGTWRYKG